MKQVFVDNPIELNISVNLHEKRLSLKQDSLIR